MCVECVEDIFYGTRSDIFVLACADTPCTERLYQIEHPRLVSLFDELSPVNEGEFGYWISKPWLKGTLVLTISRSVINIVSADWRLAKPKMHSSVRPDLPPDDPEYVRHVKCEHDGLTPNIISRKRISPAVGVDAPQLCTLNSTPGQAYELLKDVFLDWSTLSTDAELCAVCEALIHMSKEDKRGAKIQAEEEKVRPVYNT